MRIDQLHLLAYGPFTDRTLDFSQTSFHLIYGPNEGGKSSALRAIGALLFGIPARTDDNFVHRYADLRVGAQLTNSAGDTVAFARRKGRRPLVTLDGAETFLPDNLLDAFLQDLSHQRFGDIYCMDHQTFRAGGQLLRELRGLADDSLLAASSSIHFPTLQAGLNAEIDEIFAAKKRSGKIKTGIAAFQVAKQQKLNCEASVRTWQALNDELDSWKARKGEVVKQRVEMDTERRRLEQIRRALPKIAEWKQLSLELQGQNPTVLPDIYSAEERQSCQSQLRFVDSQISELDCELDETQVQLRNLELSPLLMASAEAIEFLHQRIGTQLKHRADRETIQHKLRAAQRDIEQMRDALPGNPSIDTIPSLRIAREHRAAIRHLATEERGLRQRVRDAGKMRGNAERRLASVSEKLESTSMDRDQDDRSTMQEVAELEKHLRSAESHVAIEAALKERREALAKLTSQTQDELSKLPFWNADLETLVSAEVPLRETIEQFVSDFVRLHERIDAHEQRLEHQTVARNRLRAEIASSRKLGAVVTEEDLAEARARREDSWHRLRQAWNGRIVEPSTDREDVEALSRAFEAQVANADLVADRIRYEADRAAELLQREQNEAVLSEEVRRLAEEKQALESEHAALKERWQAEWDASGVTAVRSPQEMITWLQARGKLVEWAERITEWQHDLARKDEQCRCISTALQNCLAPLTHRLNTPESLPALIQMTKQWMEEHRAQAAQRAQLEADRARAAEELNQLISTEEQAAAEWAHWQAEWSMAMQWIQCDASTLAAQAVERLDCIDELSKSHDSLTEYAERLSEIDADTNRFRKDVAELAGRIAPSLNGGDPIEVAQELHRRLKGARRNQQLAESKTKQWQSQTEKRKLLCQQRTSLLAKLDRFVELAGVDSIDRLGHVEGISQTARRQKDLERDFALAGGGLDVSQFVAQIEQIEPAELDARIAQLAAEILEQDELRDSAVRRIGELTLEMDEINGKDEAARADQTAMHCLAEVHEAAGRYLQLKIAASILRSQVERYREENKDPLLAKASEYFAAMTCNEFSGLQIDYDDSGAAIIVGVRRNRELVDASAMSDGTLDPMFLSLRLAYLQRRLSQNEPMPFIVDDILIHLDQQRSLATLQVLADLSQETQVFFFTHHQRLRELANQHLAAEILTIHELEPRDSSSAGTLRKAQ